MAASTCAPGFHRLVPWVTFHRAPTGPYPEHTTFIVVRCIDCGAHEYFPRDNYERCTPAFRTLIEHLAQQASGFVTERLP